MANIISVPFAIVADSGITESNPRDGAYAKVKFKCYWNDHYQLIKDLMWSSVLAGPGRIIRTFPFPYPPSPNLYCLSIDSVEPFGKPLPIFRLGLPWLATDEAIVTASFGYLPFTQDNSDPSGKPYTTTTFGVSGEFLTFPNSTYHFTSGTPSNAPTNTPIGLVIPQMEIVQKRHWMPYLPVNEMLILVGKVNNAPFAIGNFACPVGTLLFMGGPTEPASDPQGNPVQDVEYRFVWRPVPWNNYMHPDGVTGFCPVADGSSNPPYAGGDFSLLP